jgi:hypothetical protein
VQHRKPAWPSPIELNPKSAIDLRATQSLRREDNALLPLSGLGSAAAYEAALPLQAWTAKS